VVNPGAADVGRQSRAWRFSLCVSVLIHFTAVSGLTAWSTLKSLRFSFRRPAAGNMLEVTYTKVKQRGPGEAAPDIVDTLIGSIPERLEQAMGMKPEERAKRMRKGLKDIMTVEESSLNEIADLFGAAQDRAYEPVVPPPPGPFVVGTEIPYSMKKTDDGGFSVVLLDKDGRTMTIVHSKEEVTEDLKSAYEVFQMMEQMPALKNLYMRFAAQYLPQLKGEKHE
jgi:hypothetical protein